MAGGLIRKGGMRIEERIARQQGRRMIKSALLVELGIVASSGQWTVMAVPVFIMASSCAVRRTCGSWAKVSTVTSI
jgi:hypothetical protein